jgi:hypothetical protein
VSDFGGLAIHIKTYLNAKEELWKLKYISPCKHILIFTQKKNPLKETKIQTKMSFNSITNLKVSTQAKILSSFKNLHIKIK